MITSWDKLTAVRQQLRKSKDWFISLLPSSLPPYATIHKCAFLCDKTLLYIFENETKMMPKFCLVIDLIECSFFSVVKKLLAVRTLSG